METSSWPVSPRLTLWFTLGDIHSVGLDKQYRYIIISSGVVSLSKNPLCSAYSSLPRFLLNPGNHWFFFYSLENHLTQNKEENKTVFFGEISKHLFFSFSGEEEGGEGRREQEIKTSKHLLTLNHNIESTWRNDKWPVQRLSDLNVVCLQRETLKRSKPPKTFLRTWEWHTESWDKARDRNKNCLKSPNQRERESGEQ